MKSSLKYPVIEQSVSADERRHGVAHLAPWLSLRDLMEKTKDICTSDIEIPSKALVRIQFTPKESLQPYGSHIYVTLRCPIQDTAATTACISDMHYCCSQLKYLKEFAVMNRDHCAIFFVMTKPKSHLLNPDMFCRLAIVENKPLPQAVRPWQQRIMTCYAAALLQVCLKPCMEANNNMKSFSGDVRDLADCFIKYSAHLKLPLEKQIDQQNSSTQSRTVAYIKLQRSVCRNVSKFVTCLEAYNFCYLIINFQLL